MITNRVGPPVRGADFFGRETFVNLASDKLKAGHVLLAAPRRFGKTSVMYRLMDNPQWDYRIVHADLEHLTDPASLIAELTEKLAKDGKLARFLSGLSWLSQETWARFRETVEEIELFEAKIKLKDRLRGSWQEGGEELFKRLAAADSTVVFFLDEFPMMVDRMARSEKHCEGAKLMLHWLRALRVGPKLTNVRFLIAGSIGIGRVLILRLWYDIRDMERESRRLERRFRYHVRANHARKAHDVLEHHRYLMEAMVDSPSRLQAMERIIHGHLRLKDATTVKTELLSGISPSDLSDALLDKLIEAGCLSQEQVANAKAIRTKPISVSSDKEYAEIRC